MMAKIHIGKKIKEVWRSSRLKGTEFASLINKDRQVIYDIFERETIDTGLLQTISKVLNHDFFSYYNQNQLGSPKDSKADCATKAELEALSQTIDILVKEVQKLHKEPQKLKRK